MRFSTRFAIKLAFASLSFFVLSISMQSAHAQSFGDTWPNLRCFYHPTIKSDKKAIEDLMFKAECDQCKLPKQKEWPFMAKAIEKIMKQDPDNGSLYMILAVIEEHIGEPEKAKVAFARMKELAPDGKGIENLRNFIDRKTNLEQIDKDDATWLVLGRGIFEDDFHYWYFRSGPWHAVAAEQKKGKEPKLSKEEETFRKKYWDAEWALYSDGHYLKCIRLIDELIATNKCPDLSPLLTLKADAQVRTGSDAEAEKNLLEAIKVERPYKYTVAVDRPRQVLADLYYKQGRLSGCKKLLEELSRTPGKENHRSRLLAQRALLMVSAKESSGDPIKRTSDAMKDGINGVLPISR